MLKWLLSLFTFTRQTTPDPVPEKVVKLAERAKRKRVSTPTQDAE